MASRSVRKLSGGYVMCSKLAQYFCGRNSFQRGTLCFDCGISRFVCDGRRREIGTFNPQDSDPRQSNFVCQTQLRVPRLSVTNAAQQILLQPDQTFSLFGVMGNVTGHKRYKCLRTKSSGVKTLLLFSWQLRSLLPNPTKSLQTAVIDRRYSKPACFCRDL